MLYVISSNCRVRRETAMSYLQIMHTAEPTLVSLDRNLIHLSITGNYIKPVSRDLPCKMVSQEKRSQRGTCHVETRQAEVLVFSLTSGVT